jgi:biotin synthase-like enzyme
MSWGKIWGLMFKGLKRCAGLMVGMRVKVSDRVERVGEMFKGLKRCAGLMVGIRVKVSDRVERTVQPAKRIKPFNQRSVLNC